VKPHCKLATENLWVDPRQCWHFLHVVGYWDREQYFFPV